MERRDFIWSSGFASAGVLLGSLNSSRCQSKAEITNKNNKMRIESIEIYRVRMPLIYPFRTAFGNDDTIESIIVRIHSGISYGWGESTPWQSPGYSSESASTSFIIIRDFLAPLLLGQEISSGDELQKKLAPVKDNFFAKAALDLAWWDLDARSRGIPLYRLLGGKKKVVYTGADFGIMENVDELIKTIGAAVRAGFRRIKLKYRPGWELDMLSAVRKAFPDTVFHVDCNSAYTLDDTEMLMHLDRFNLAMIEQPLMHDDLIDHSVLQKKLKTPICLDESITTLYKARQAISIGACRWINIKPGRVGGLTNAVKIHDYCQGAGIPCWVGGMLESSLGAHHCLALATLPNFIYPNDIFPTDRFFLKDLSDPPMVLSGPSQVKVTEEPGCGAEPEISRLKAQTIEKAMLK
jgi:o-succinylbenzoate synthase